MDSDRTSRFVEHLETPLSNHTGVGNGNPPAVNGAAIAHADTDMTNKLKELVPDSIEIKPSAEQEEENAQEGSVTNGTESDKANGLDDVPLNNNNQNVGFRHLPSSSEYYEA